MRKITGLITAVAVVGLAGCATMNVSSHIERGTNFTEPSKPDAITVASAF